MHNMQKEKFDQVKYVNQYAKENYDRLNIQVPKGMKAQITDHYKRKGYSSLNSYVNEIIRKDMEGGANRLTTIPDSLKTLFRNSWYCLCLGKDSDKYCFSNADRELLKQNCVTIR